MQQNTLSDIPLFVEVARQRSFTKAAAILDMPISTLSRRISALEKKLNIPLLHRNSRNVELTPSGKVFYERCIYIVNEAKIAFESVTQNMQNPSGTVRISMGGDLFHGYMAQALNEFAKKWPEIKLNVRFTDRWVDLMKEPFDLDFRVGDDLPDSSLVARKLGSGSLSLYATPVFLERFGPIKKVEDLSKAPCIGLDNENLNGQLTNGKKKVRVQINRRYSFNTLSGALNFVLADLGVAPLSPIMVERYVESGQLVQVLPGWTTFPLNLYIVMPNNQMPLRVRLLVDYLVDYLELMNAQRKQEGKEIS